MRNVEILHLDINANGKESIWQTSYLSFHWTIFCVFVIYRSVLPFVQTLLRSRVYDGYYEHYNTLHINHKGG